MTPTLHTPALAAAVLGLALCMAQTAQAAGTAPAGAAKPGATRADTAKVNRPRPAAQPGKAKAPAAAAVPAAAPVLSPGQLDVVDRVLTGVADCEFKQKISVLPVPGQHGHFEIQHLKQRYRMTPRETATGAVRLEDPHTGMLWIQIPAKSMLMDSRRGQRVVDHCQHAEQRAALAAVEQAAVSLGIEPQAAAAASAASAAAAANAASAAPTGQ